MQKRLNEGPVAVYNTKVEKQKALEKEVDELCVGRRVYNVDVKLVMKNLGLKKFPFKLK